MIVGRQVDGSWGKAVVERLAADLQAEFPGVGGFSASNLWRMKSFYETYASSEKLAPLVPEIAWSHNLIIVERGSDPLDRQVRERRENPSIGIILCKEKHRTIVEYALHDATKPIGVATYRIVKRLPRELRGELPEPKEIAKLLESTE